MPNYFPEINPTTGEFISPLVTDAIDAAARTAGASAFVAGENVTFTPGEGGVVTVSATGGSGGPALDWTAAINALNGA